MSEFLLGIDYGTGGAKGCIIDTQGEVFGYSFNEYPIINPKSGWSEHDPIRYWQIACEIIRDCLSQSKIQPSEIKGIAISSALPSMVMVDEEGNPVNNAYNLMDRRATEQVQWIKDQIGEQRVFNITGNRLDDHPSLVNVLWEKKNRPVSFKKIHKVVSIEGFIVYKLTGKYTLAHQNAVFMGIAYNLVEKKFEHDILDQA